MFELKVTEVDRATDHAFSGKREGDCSRSALIIAMALVSMPGAQSGRSAVDNATVYYELRLRIII